MGAAARNLLAAPVIYSLVIPLAALDAWVALYQAVCFRLWGIPRVERSRHMLLDRQRLPYLSAAQKLNCAYCAYANGVIAVAREVASRTEQYWCPIKHAAAPAEPHERYGGFAAYGDPEEYRARAPALRLELRRSR